MTITTEFQETLKNALLEKGIKDEDIKTNMPLSLEEIELIKFNYSYELENEIPDSIKHKFIDVDFKHKVYAFYRTKDNEILIVSPFTYFDDYLNDNVQKLTFDLIYRYRQNNLTIAKAKAIVKRVLETATSKKILFNEQDNDILSFSYEVTESDIRIFSKNKRFLHYRPIYIIEDSFELLFENNIKIYLFDHKDLEDSFPENLLKTEIEIKSPFLTKVNNFEKYNLNESETKAINILNKKFNIYSLNEQSISDSILEFLKDDFKNTEIKTKTRKYYYNDIDYTFNRDLRDKIENILKISNNSDTQDKFRKLYLNKASNIFKNLANNFNRKNHSLIKKVLFINTTNKDIKLIANNKSYILKASNFKFNVIIENDTFKIPLFLEYSPNFKFKCVKEKVEIENHSLSTSKTYHGDYYIVTKDIANIIEKDINKRNYKICYPTNILEENEKEIICDTLHFIA